MALNATAIVVFVFAAEAQHTMDSVKHIFCICSYGRTSRFQLINIPKCQDINGFWAFTLEPLRPSYNRCIKLNDNSHTMINV